MCRELGVWVMEWLRFASGRHTGMASELFEDAVMRTQRSQKGAVLYIRDVELDCRLFEYFPDRRIMDVAYRREQMMFDLAVQPTQKERGRAALRREIRRGVHLVFGPVFLYAPGVVRGREAGPFDHVRQLEHEPHCEALGQMHREKPDQDLIPGRIQYQQW